MWMSWAVLACAPSSGQNGKDGAAGEVDVELDPVAPDFGVVPLGESAEQSLTLYNEGKSDVLVPELRLSDTATLEVVGLRSLEIPAGAKEQLTVRWTPSETGDLVDGSLDLRIGTRLDSLSDLVVPLAGKVSGPNLTLSDVTADLGTVIVGCTSSFEVLATNSGTETLELSGIAVTNDQEFSVEDGAGAPLVVPIRIEPGLSIPIRRDLHADGGALVDHDARDRIGRCARGSDQREREWHGSHRRIRTRSSGRSRASKR